MEPFHRELREAALKYVKSGWHSVLPVKAGQKFPPLVEGGWAGASSDPDEVEALWDRYPDANIAWSPGMGGDIVIDVDGPSGLRSLQDLGLGWDPNNDDCHTMVVATPGRGGGFHLIYYLPFADDGSPDYVLVGKGRIAPGLEFFSAKQYGLLPPSRVEAGQYRWHNNVQSPAAIPKVLLDLVMAYGSDRPVEVWEPKEFDPDCTYCPSAAEGMLGDVARASEGVRNDELYAAVRRFLKLSDVEHRLWVGRFVEAGVSTGLTAAECESTFRSALVGHGRDYGAPGDGGGCKAGEYDDVVLRVGVPAESRGTPDDPGGRWDNLVFDDEVVSETIDWVVPGLIIRRKPLLLYGEGGEGKSQFAMRVAAELAEERNTGVLWLSGDLEDMQDTLKPRWVAAGGPSGHFASFDVRVASPDFVRSAEDFPALYDRVDAGFRDRDVDGCGIVIIDPIYTMLSGANSNSVDEVGDQLALWASELAQRDLVSIWISHTNKDEGKSAINAANGSKRFQTFVRTMALMGPDPEEPDDKLAKAIVLVKGNSSPKGYGWRGRISFRDVVKVSRSDDGTTSRVSDSTEFFDIVDRDCEIESEKVRALTLNKGDVGGASKGGQLFKLVKDCVMQGSGVELLKELFSRFGEVMPDLVTDYARRECVRRLSEDYDLRVFKSGKGNSQYVSRAHMSFEDCKDRLVELGVSWEDMFRG